MAKCFKSPILQVLTFSLLFMVLLVGATHLFGDQEKLQKHVLESEFWSIKVLPDHEFDLGIIGDSRAYRGINPAVIEEYNPAIKGINLGFMSGGLTPELFDLAEQHLKQDGKKVIVIAITPHSLTEKASSNGHLREWQDKPWFDKISSRYLEKILVYFSPTALKAISKSRPDPYQQKFYANGFVESDYLKRDQTSALNSYKQQFWENSVSAPRVDILLDRIKFWLKQDFIIFALRPPVYSELLKMENEMSGFESFKLPERLRKLGVNWIELNEADFETYDGSHLTGESAARLSGRVGEEVKKVLAHQ